jgi:hypothetical protein
MARSGVRAPSRRRRIFMPDSSSSPTGNITTASRNPLLASTLWSSIMPGAGSPDGFHFREVDHVLTQLALEHRHEPKAHIRSATGKTYRLVTADRGDTIKVPITGTKTGYTTASRYLPTTARLR